MEHLASQPGVVAAGDPGRELGVRPHLAALDVRGGHGAVRRQRLAVATDPERRREDVVREVAVERRDRGGHPVEVAVEEHGEAAAVVEGAAPAAPGDEERAFGEAEVLLHVDQQEQGALLVVRRRPQIPLDGPPPGRFRHRGGVRVKAEILGPVRVEEGRKHGGQLQVLREKTPRKMLASAAYASGSLPGSRPALTAASRGNPAREVRASEDLTGRCQ